MAQQKIANGKSDAQQIARGRYLLKVAGCNDCHTAGFAMTGGKLLGDKLGWRGPWGTTYAVNLAIYSAFRCC
jgi:mono/diheme cytochrome c family protein